MKFSFFLLPLQLLYHTIMTHNQAIFDGKQGRNIYEFKHVRLRITLSRVENITLS